MHPMCFIHIDMFNLCKPLKEGIIISIIQKRRLRL